MNLSIIEVTILLKVYFKLFYVIFYMCNESIRIFYILFGQISQVENFIFLTIREMQFFFS